MKSRLNDPIPVIDLFAGAGGLGEGFSSLQQDGLPRFEVRLSVERDRAAHQTLELRAFFRQFAPADVPEEYYQHLRGKISRSELFASYPDQAEAAEKRAWCVTLGSKELPTEEIDERIREATRHSSVWVLVGGPPCQAYSVAGRGRIRSEPGYRTEDDHRHFLYLEYLRILKEHRPPVFLMENVKGILSSKVAGRSIFIRMIGDLQNPDGAFKSEETFAGYRIYSLSRKSRGFDLFGDSANSPTDYVVECEKYGVPQNRHRVLLLGVRQNIRIDPGILRTSESCPTISDVISDLPKLRAGFSLRSARDSDEASNGSNWRDALKAIPRAAWAKHKHNDPPEFRRTRDHLTNVVKSLRLPRAGQGAEAILRGSFKGPLFQNGWYHDPRLRAVCNHTSRTHMKSDFHRYMWASCYAAQNNVSPRLKDFPRQLWPEHKNIDRAQGHGNFSDRFRVQLRSEPSTTVMSHIAKDGHYYIHYDPAQCRSLTVREAARLQTFPDNYFFCGNRTEQYIQVGNAVPPLLAHQIAGIILELLVNAGLTNDRSDFSRKAKLEHVSNSLEKHGTRARRSVADARNGTAVQTA